MRLPEQRLADWFLGAMPSSWHVQRIESSTNAGIPDLNLCLDGGREIWLELKVIPKLRPAQHAWMYRRALAGGKCAVLVRRVGKVNWDLYVVHADERWGSGDPLTVQQVTFRGSDEYQLRCALAQL